MKRRERYALVKEGKGKGKQQKRQIKYVGKSVGMEELSGEKKKN